MGACSAADGGAASPGPGRAGFRKISGDPDPDPMSRSYAEAVSFTKIDHWSILVKEMRAMGAMLVKMAVLRK